MAFRVACHADGSNSMFLQETGFKDLQGAVEVAFRFRSVTGNDENLLDSGIPGEACQQVVKYGQGLDAAGNDVRYRLHTLSAKAVRKRYGVPAMGAWSLRDVNTCAGADDIIESPDACRLENSRFDGIVSDEVLNGKLVHVVGEAEASTKFT